jgi:hypothetical protein
VAGRGFRKANDLVIPKSVCLRTKIAKGVGRDVCLVRIERNADCRDGSSIEVFVKPT